MYILFWYYRLDLAGDDGLERFFRWPGLLIPVLFLSGSWLSDTTKRLHLPHVDLLVRCFQIRVSFVEDNSVISWNLGPTPGLAGRVRCLRLWIGIGKFLIRSRIMVGGGRANAIRLFLDHLKRGHTRHCCIHLASRGLTFAVGCDGLVTGAL